MQKICIVLATYNGEKYLEQMLDSLIAQKRPADFIVAVDDGSTDSTVSILQRYQSKLPLQITVSSKNEGHRAAFSKALAMAKPQLQGNDLIALADQDDIWLPYKLKILEQKIDDEALVFGDAEVVDAKGKIFAASWRTYSKISTKVSLKAQIAGINNVTGCLCIFKARLLDYILPIPANVTVHDRWVAMFAERHGGIKAIPDVLVQYRIHGENAVGGKDNTTMSETLSKQILWIDTILGNASSLQLSKKEIRFAQKLKKLSLARQRKALVPGALPWICMNYKDLFLQSQPIPLLKKILFTCVGLPFAKKFFGKV